MSAKPTDLPVWNTDGTNRTTPDPAKQAAGWSLNEKPPSSWFNWYMWLVYTWITHFSEGEWEGDVEIDGTLTVNPTVPPLGPVLAVTGNAAITGAVTATSDVSAGGDLYHTTVHSKVLKANVGAYMTSGAGFVQGVSDGSTGSGTGNPGGFGGAGALQFAVVGGGGTCNARQECELEAGSRVTQVKVLYDRVTGANITITLARYNIATNIHSTLQTFTTADFGAHTAGNNLKTCVLTTPITLGHGEDISVAIDDAAVGDKFRAIQPYWYRPHP